VCLIGLPTIICSSCKSEKSTTGRDADEANKPAGVEAGRKQDIPAEQGPVEQKREEKAVAEALADAPNVVAKIGDCIITKEDLMTRLMMELRPKPYEHRVDFEAADANTVLTKMIAEKAMVMEMRKEGYVVDEIVSTSLRRTTERNLAKLLLEKQLKNKIKVEESEIKTTMKANNLTRERAKQMLERTKAKRFIDEYYDGIMKKRNVKKLRDNFARAAQIHLRLLLQPKEQQRLRFIRLKQVRDELTSEEKNIVLASFDGGRVTLKDWFNTLCDMSPPSRPRDLHTLDGVERLLDNALRLPLFVAEAKELGLDRDKNLLKEDRERKDGVLLGEARKRKMRDIPEPNEQEMVAYFKENKGAFGTPPMIKIDQIWCQDLATAQKVKGQLKSEKDFESVRQKHSLQKEGSPFDTHPGEEGIFFQDLWKSEPNDIVGPIKGFYGAEIKWRVVKILEKKPAKNEGYSDNVKNHVKMKITEERRNKALDKYRKELLRKYPYTIYRDRIEDIDPLDIP
jgi:hypothetical protein